MKKRLLSMLLMLVMCFMLITPAFAGAAETAPANTEATQQISTWAISDVSAGITYGIYPTGWTEKDMTGPIKQSQLRILLAGLRYKLLTSDCAEQSRYTIPKLSYSVTVEEALNAFYSVLTDYDYTEDIGLNYGLSPVDYMKAIGVYTGQNGEQGLDERCSIEQAMVISSRLVTILYEGLGASSKGFFWEVKSGENTVYLLGSIHIASPVIYPMSQRILQAFHSSDALIVEALLNDESEMLAYNELLTYTDGTTLKDHVSPEIYQLTVETGKLVGLTEEAIAMMKPWVLFLTFEVMASAGAGGADQNAEEQNAEAQNAAALGIDATLMNSAYMYQKPIYQIEGLLKQATILDSLSPGTQEFFLLNNIVLLQNAFSSEVEVNVNHANDFLNATLEYWRKGDVEAFKKTMGGNSISALEEIADEEIKGYLREWQDKFWTQRDKGMADYIDNLLKAEGSNSYFVVVGSGHYISEYSVTDMLTEMGYAVNQIK